MVGFQVHHRALHTGGGIVDEDVEATKGIRDIHYQALDLIRFADVGPERLSAHTKLLFDGIG